MISKRTLKRIKKGTEKQANQMIRAVKKINKPVWVVNFEVENA
jgi:hypothetical protein